MNFTAWKIWGGVDSQQRQVVPVAGAFVIGFCLALIPMSLLVSAAVASLIVMIYLPIAIGVGRGPIHSAQDIQRIMPEQFKG